MAINFPDSPSLNDLYTDSTTGFTYQWDGEVWKSAVLSNPDRVKELGNISALFDGIETEFALTISGASVTPVNAQQLIINLGGVIQNAGTDYTVSGSNITFTTPPGSGLSFTGLFVGSAISLNSLSTYAVEPEDLTTGGPSWNTSGDVAISGVATVSNTGSATTALYVDGGARITGILTVGSSSIRIDGDNNTINVGTGLTINSTGITAGFITATTYYGDGSNLDNVGLGSTSSINTSGIITASYFYGSGIGITNAGPLGRIAAISYSPGIGETNVGLTTNIVITFNKPLLSAGGTITLRTDSDTGTIIESFDVGTSSSISISGGVLTVNPTASLGAGTTHYLVVPEGTFKDKLNTSTNAGITTYSFTSQQLNFELYVMGRNDNYGQLGLNDVTNRSSPTQLPGTQWSIVLSGSFDSKLMVTKTDGTLWTWGRNDYGQLGLNNKTYYSSPIQVPGTQWNFNEYLHGGYLDSVSTKTDGTLWAWGYNVNGQLGQNNLTYYSSPVQIPGTQWNQVFRGDRKTFATKTDGTLWAWGYNTYGPLGLNDQAHRSSPRQIPGTQWKMVSAGFYFTLATKTDGTAWVWGRDQGGCLGLNATGAGAQYSSPVQLPGTEWDVLYSDTSNSTHSMGYKTDGTLWSWGYNNSGQLGHNDTVKYSSPRQIPGTQWTNKFRTSQSAMTSAIKDDGTLWAWGYGDYGGLGQNDRTDRSSPVQIPGTQWYRTANSGRTLYAIKQT